jgi:hypothetical protein
MRRAGSLAAAALAIGFFGLFVAQWSQFLRDAGTDNIGTDWETYHTAAVRWLQGGGFYLERQLAGPYVITDGDVLYPPPFLVLLAPFTVIPAPLWWITPLAITAGVVMWHRPRPLGWLLVALCLWYPITGVKLLHGNPGMWFMAAVAGATLVAWPAVLVLLKPTLAPFALIGIQRRSWWLALGALALVSLLFLPMWPDYVTVIRDGQAPAGILYSLNEYPMIAIPAIAWLASSRNLDMTLDGIRARLGRVSRAT